MNSKDLCLKLLGAESEADVLSILSSVPEAAKLDNWALLDKRDTNFNVVTNQAMTGGKAATELMTNMVDAILMKHADMKGTDPRGPEAPQTMHQAVKSLVQNIPGGKLVNEDEAVLRDFARKNLVIGVTGSAREGYPCYTFVDNGEGQKPGDFEDTFLSLSKGNKKDIPFVQGKYNMGSSGVLSFCGEHWFKLIVSRRYDKKSDWGWTLMRLRPGGGTPTAEYFQPGGKIPAFKADSLYPLHQKDGKRYQGTSISSGTIIKLYDFQIGRKFKSFRGAREAFNENLAETILPFRLLDLRYEPDKNRGGDRALGVDARPFYGMEYLLLRRHRSDTEEDTEEAAVDGEKITVDIIEHKGLGRIEITAIPLKPGQPKWLQPPNSINRVFHCVNGQVQYKETRGFLTRCRLPALKDRVVIVVDATNLSYEAHNRIWKGDREHIRENMFGEQYKEIVQKAIEKSEPLRKLHERIARQELTAAAKQQSNDLFQKLVDDDPQVAALLSGENPTIIAPAAEKDETPYKGSYSPTKFVLDKRFREHGAKIPVGRTRSVFGLTDAENGYLHRAENKGKLYISDDAVRDHFNISCTLSDGRLIVQFDPIEDKVSVGDEMTFEVGLHDQSMPTPVTDTLSIRIIEPEEPKKRKKNGKEKKKKPKEKPRLGLPQFVLLTNDGREIGGQRTEKWPDGFSLHDGGLIENLGEDLGVLYKINYDNSFHLNYLNKAPNQIAKDAVTEKYITGMRLLMLGFENAFKAVEKADGDASSWVNDYGEEIRRLAARGAASTVLALADHLPKIAAAKETDE